jgi:hypothetical protein
MPAIRSTSTSDAVRTHCGPEPLDFPVARSLGLLDRHEVEITIGPRWFENRALLPD